MVRLRQLAREQQQFEQKNFNSIMVRLRLDGKISLPSAQSDFNSIMVRLRQVVVSFSGGKDRFQFHYGAIKTLTGTGITRKSTSISIPLWCD